jgi:N,N'-diacetyllegionaminate synthase
MDCLVKEKMKEIKIADKKIGNNHPVFIIAEAGVNHNGSLLNAKKLVDIAKNSGADAVKFQTYKSEEVVSKEADSAEYQKNNTGDKISQLELIKKYELSYKDFKELKDYCEKKNIIFLSTPHSFDAINFLNKLVPAYKIGSGDLTNIPFLKQIAKKKKPVILGTGMATMSEVKKAVQTIKKQGNDKIIVLHCTTSYPTNLEDVNLRVMQSMKEKLSCIIGYSDHTKGFIVPIAATALGAKVIEKHFTLDKNLPGPDHKASLGSDELKEMIQKIRNTEKILGNKLKKPTLKEKEIKKMVRKSIVANKDIKKDEKIKEDMIIIKRPGTGIPSEDFGKIIGKKAKKDIKKDQILKKNMIG